MAFGNGKSIPNQGGCTPSAPTLPSRIEDKTSVDTGVKTPMADGWSGSTNVRPKPQGGSTKGQSSAGGPKPFRA